MSELIPANIIQTVYVHPDEEYIKPFGKVWKLMESSTAWMSAVIVVGTVLANVFGRSAFSDPVVYVLLGVVAVVVFVIVIIKLVEKSEANAQVDTDSPDEGNVRVGFDALGVTVEKQMGSERYSSVIPRSDIKAISGYVQHGWLGLRDRGVVIERNDGAQFRFVLSLKKSELSDFLSEFELSLGRLEYPVVASRKLQV
ncbi:hypothetical protein [Pseudomonas sp. TWP3-1]|uniref:hypothetical protein n=1 Tax=Pseudomonas sp. TWP3-1 TaxID=2804631 RepID=UPI003CEA650E